MGKQRFRELQHEVKNQAFWQEKLAGKTITFARHMTGKEADQFGFRSKPLILFFKEGGYIFSCNKDELDGEGLFYQDPNMQEESFGQTVAKPLK